ncbi:MAG TPA: hypothetical protein VMH81_27110 [Bryobacteraceae bacterium]|nr:hypothetical protein [Bryobacteraceae bacterium]
MALAQRKINHSSALFQDLARRLKFDHCLDPAFQRFVSILRAWFPLP